MIAVIDYKMGNVGSVLNMLKRVGAEAVVSDDVGVIEKAEKLILPGVGAFDNGMKNLLESGLLPTLEQKALKEKVPVLGICLGMHLLTQRSEEGDLLGLGWVEGETVKFSFPLANGHKIPHMGWNSISVKQPSNLWMDMYDDPRFYFVHSYHVRCMREEDVLATTSYGYDFPSAIAKGNIFGTQFHPEKSHKFGMKILKNFSDL